MPGETDLQVLLRGMRPRLLDGAFVFVSGAGDAAARLAHASVREAEGLSLVLPVSDAEAAGFAGEARFGWITLEAHSSLAAVGLTAVVAARLAGAGIAANVIAGCLHDHVLVPEDRAEEALELLREPAA